MATRSSANHSQRRYIREAILSRKWILRNRPDVAKRIRAKVRLEQRSGRAAIEMQE